MVEKTWAKGWQTRLSETVKSLGYEDVASYVFENSSSTLRQLFNDLQRNKASVAWPQFIEVYYVDAFVTDRLRIAVLDSFVRTCKMFLRRGWENGNNYQTQQHKLFQDWPLPSSFIVAPKLFGFACWNTFKELVRKRIDDIAPSPDWCPDNRDDPVISKIFEPFLFETHKIIKPQPENLKKPESIQNQPDDVQINSEGLEHEYQLLSQKIEPLFILTGLRLAPLQTDDDFIPTGSTKFGGIPDVNTAFEWPHWKNHYWPQLPAIPLQFLCQINLAEVKAASFCSLLPESGILSFFYDPTQHAWGLDPDDSMGWRVVYFPEDGLQSYEHGKIDPRVKNNKTCSVLSRVFLFLPDPDSIEGDSLNSIYQGEGSYQDYYHSHSGNFARHHLMGYAEAYSDLSRVICEMTSAGYEYDSKSDFISPDEDGSFSEWILLLELKSEPVLDWRWGDAGSLTFWIRKTDLRNHCFDHARVVLNSS
ncbi:MAG: YwqG family protein [Planctomycetaceae bacterium]